MKSLDVAEARAQVVLAAITNNLHVKTVEDVRRLFATWHESILEAAIDILVADGRVTEDAYGILEVSR